MNKGRLNVDIAGSISALEDMLKEFRMKKIIYKLFFRGRGLEFDGYRDFAPDDDAERIDWKASARAQKMLVKQYIEERDLKIMFMIDIGDNMVFGSTEKIKCEFITEFVTAFSKVMLNSNDRVGFVLFSDKVTHFVDCKTGERQLNLFIDTLSNGENYGGTTNLDMALNFAIDYFNNSISSVILVSDFLRITSETEKKLGLLSHKFETIAVRVRDPLDITLPNIEGEIILENPEANSQIIINPSVARKSYEKYAMEQGKMIEDIFKKSELDYLDLVTDTPFA
ncbi:MAG: DUF58 domain-containing protein, partial [Nanoarchaeota archaeon]